MKPTNKKPAPALVIAVLVALVIAAPGFVLAYTVIGGSLGFSTSGNGYQRDFRVWNNSTDPASNNNTTPNAAYPGTLGAVMSVWKAAKAWASENVLASKNFDYDFQGTNTSNPSNANTVGWEATGCGGGTLAYTETPISDGWRIVMCDSWNWEDGPGSPGPAFSDIDIQGVAAHELGHALGMGHSQSGNCGGACSGRPTMCAVICFDGVSERDLVADDAAGLESIYGLKPGGKPVITSLTGSTSNGGTLIINGTAFASIVNVKFTAGTGVNTGTIPGVVYGAASSAGGTQVSVIVPAAAVDGNVIVWQPAQNLMSNAFPIDINFVPPVPPSITSFSPQDVAAFYGGVITVTGNGFAGATQMNVGGTVLVPPSGFTIQSNTSIMFTAANATALGPVSVTVTTPIGISPPMSFNYVETFPAKLVTPAVAFSNTPIGWTFGAGVNDIGYVLVSLDPTTIDYGTPYQILLNFILLTSVPANSVGIGSFGLTLPPGLSGVTFYSQVVAFDDISPAFSASNVTTTFILF